MYINNYSYDNEKKQLMYAKRGYAYYRDGDDPLKRKLYAHLTIRTNHKTSIVYNLQSEDILNDVFFVCACIYDDDCPEKETKQKYLDWIDLSAFDNYFSYLNDIRTRYYCYVYACVIAIIDVQETLPTKVKLFRQSATHKILESKWATAWGKHYNNFHNVLFGKGEKTNTYHSDLRPSTNFCILESFSVESLLTFYNLNPYRGIRTLLSHFRNTSECQNAIDFFEQDIQHLVRRGSIWKLYAHSASFFTNLRVELKYTGEIGREPYTVTEPTKSSSSEENQIAQQQLTDKDTEIKKLKNKIATLEQLLNTAGKDYVCQVVAEAIEGTDDMDKEERKEKYNEIKGLLEVDSVPKEAKNAIKALLKASKKKSTGSTTINNFNGNVGQVANNVEEQHIAKER